MKLVKIKSVQFIEWKFNREKNSLSNWKIPPAEKEPEPGRGVERMGKMGQQAP